MKSNNIMQKLWLFDYVIYFLKYSNLLEKILLLRIEKYLIPPENIEQYYKFVMQCIYQYLAIVKVIQKLPVISK